MKKIGLYFGSFNPIHNTHLTIAEYARVSCNFDHVEFVVTPQNPHKSKSELAAVHHRIQMIELATGDNDNFSVNDIETNRPAPHYTIDTLRIVSQKAHNKQYSLMLGDDSFLSLVGFGKKDTEHPGWKNNEEIISNYQICIYPRAKNWLTEKIIDLVDEKYTVQNICYLKDMPRSELSATYIRRRIEKNKSIKYLTHDKVIQYLKQHKLYQEK